MCCSNANLKKITHNFNMDTASKRLFISDVPENVSSFELEEKFSNYGQVTSVEINQRKNASSANQPFFAYINLNVSNVNLQKCIKDFASKKWKGEYLNVQLAKESFLDRLKRERELESVKSEKVNTAVTHQNEKKEITATTSNGFVENFSEYPKINDVKSPKKAKSDKKPIPDVITEGIANESDNIDIVIKNNKFKTFQRKIKLDLLDSVDEVPSHKPEKIHKPKLTEADKKRIQSLADMRKEFRQQKSQIQMALANLDARPKNKIVFDNDEYDLVEKKKLENKRKKSLFDESDDEEGDVVNFEIKKQFEGEKGQKLLQLQSKFKNDKRFAMDAKFLEEEDDAEKTHETNGEITYEDEKQMQFDILEEVLGVKVAKQPAKREQSSQKQKGMLRFDPTQPEHNVFEIKTAQPEKPSKKKRKLESENKIPAADVSEKPEVSKSKFYKVTENLKDVFQKEPGTFSLLSSYKNEELYSNDPQNDQPIPIANKNVNFNNLDSPFRYDSSEGEEEREEDNNKELVPENQAVAEAALEKQRPAQHRMWNDPFFFVEDDYRLQEGLDFIRRLEIEDKSEFVKLRRSLKEIVKTKVRNTQRKNKMFKKKLGGRKKRIKMKKALKK